MMNIIDEFYNNELVEFMKLNKEQKLEVVFLCIEREMKLYQKLSKDEQWARSEVFRNILNECWQSLYNKNKIDEKYWKLFDDNRPENVSEDLKDYDNLGFSYCLIIDTHFEELLDLLLDELDGEEVFKLESLELYNDYFDEQNFIEMKKRYIEQEMEFQKNDMEFVKKSPSYEEMRQYINNQHDISLI